MRKKSSITTWNRWKKEGNSKVSKKNNSTIVVCVCVEFDTPEEFKVQMEWVPQNNRSIQAKWKWNNLLVRLVILLHAIAIKTCYKQLKINNTVHLRVPFILMKATEGSYYFDSWRIQNVGCFVDIIVLLCFVLASSKRQFFASLPAVNFLRIYFQYFSN